MGGWKPYALAAYAELVRALMTKQAGVRHGHWRGTTGPLPSVTTRDPIRMSASGVPDLRDRMLADRRFSERRTSASPGLAVWLPH
jgi:hypothetical protein